jgi:MoaA/NifB/PqqE/SkfB family radical SAM enzyme
MGLRVNVLTNGIEMDKGFLERIEKSANRRLLSVTVSLDALDRVLSNIRTLSESGLPGEVHATVTGINYTELSALRGFSEGLRLRFSFSSYSEAVSYASARDKGLSVSGKRTKENVIAEMERVASGMDRLTRTFTEDNVRHLREEDIGPCDAFTHSLRVTPDGRLSPCLELPPVMDLLSEDINERWEAVKNASMERIRACYGKTPCFYGCTRGMGSIKKRPAAAASGALKEISR